MVSTITMFSTIFIFFLILGIELLLKISNPKTKIVQRPQ